MKIIIWHLTNFHDEDDVKVYYLGDKTDREMQDALRELWERELNRPNYDIDEHLEETYFDGTSARVTDYSWFIDMWITEAEEKI